jgi:nucleotide-binding universal stress UspA family protein
MYRHLLVPLDGSPFAEHALPSALALANRGHAALQVARVHVPFPYDSAHPTDMALDELTRNQEHVYLDSVCKRLAPLAQVPVSSELLDGPVVETLLNHLADNQFDLVIMTTHGRGPISRFWLGSVADELMRHTDTPLLLIRAHEGVAQLAVQPALQHILIPLDGSELAEQVLEHALALGKLMQSRYALLRVIEPLPMLGYDLTGTPVGGLDVPLLQQLQENAQGYLEHVAARLRERGASVTTHVVFNPSVPAAILTNARALGVDLIALETHGQGGLARLLLGSVADKVLRGAITPVLIHRPATHQSEKRGRDS